MFKRKKLIILGIVIVILIVAAFFIPKNISGNVVKDNTPGHYNLINNCECVERNNLICLEGFELDDDGFCRKDNFLAFPAKGCSQYDCDGEIWKVKP